MARTVGFSLGEEEEARLDRLVRRRGTTNRSRFLREALEVVECYDRARDLEALQAYGEVAAGVQPHEIPDLLAHVAHLDDEALRTTADQLLDALHHDDMDQLRTPPSPFASGSGAHRAPRG